MASYFHIYLEAKPGVSAEEVEQKFNLAVDWYRYAKNSWVVKTTSNASKWQARLLPLVKPEGTLLILKLDVAERRGWISKTFWEWLKKDEAKSADKEGQEDKVALLLTEEPKK